MGDGVPTIGGLKRLTYLPDRETDEEQGLLIAGQEYFDVFFTGGEIRNVNIINATITTPVFSSPIPLSSGGTASNLTDPNADRIMFWDDSAGQVTWLTPGSGLVITGTTMTVAGVGLGDVTGPASSVDNSVARFDGITGKVIQNSGVIIDDSGNITAANLSGTNTGNQTIELTGDVTGSGTGTFAATIANNVVSNAKIRTSSALSVMGRSANSTGNIADISAGSDNQVLRRSGTTLGFGAINLASSSAVTGSLPVGNGGTGNLTYATGDILYASGATTLSKLTIGSSGQILTVSGGLPVWAANSSGWTVGSASSLSGTSVDITGIPSTAKVIYINLTGASSSGASNYLIQLGTSGGIENTGYAGAGSTLDTVVASTNYSNGFGIRSAGNANILNGTMVINLSNSASNTWSAQGSFGLSSSASLILTAGAKSLSAALDRIRITTVNGTDTFDAGTINITYGF